MVTDPVGSSGFNSNPLSNHVGWGKGDIPPGKSLPPDDPWCKALRRLFPNIPENQIEAYASRFRDNMFNMIQEEIKRAAKKAKEAANKLKKVAQGDE